MISILLAGGAEFGGQMAQPDRRVIDLAGGSQAALVIVPTAAAPDNNHARAGANGERWFRSLGAQNVRVAPLIDRDSADDPQIAGSLRSARLIYLLGGFTRYLTETLRGSLAWQAMLQAAESGAVIAGSSAGAMALCEHVYDPGSHEIIPGLGAVPGACVLPHHNTFGQRWAGPLIARLPDATLLGIDERTAMLNDGAGGGWKVYGQGGVTIYRGGKVFVYRSGDGFESK